MYSFIFSSVCMFFVLLIQIASNVAGWNLTGGIRPTDALLFCNVIFRQDHINNYETDKIVESSGYAVERQSVNRRDGGLIPPAAVSKLRQFHNPTFACVFWKRH